MHAVVAHVGVRDPAEARHALDEEIIPTAKTAPGLVGGYFIALDDIALDDSRPRRQSRCLGRGVRDEEHARAAVPAEGGT